MLIPRQTTPALTVDTLAHGPFDLGAETPENFTLVTFYRGLHCPICANYLKDMERQVPEFEKRGVDFDRHQFGHARTRREDGRKDRRAKYSGSATACPFRWRAPGACSFQLRAVKHRLASRSRHSFRSRMFLIRPDRTLYYGSVQTMPFVRPHFSELVQALDFVLAKNYPARGEYVGEV